MKEPLKKYRKILTVIVVVVAALGFASWRACSGVIGDDLWYSYTFMSDDEVKALGGWAKTCVDGVDCFLGKPIETWGEVFSSIKNHYLYWDNARMANSLTLAANMFPRWLVDLLHGAVFGLGVCLLLSLACPRWKERPLLAVCVVFLIWMAWPWYDMKSSSCFFFNYLWSSTAALGYIYLLYKEKDHDGSLRYRVLFLATALFTSLIHEAATGALSAAVFCYLVLHKGNKTQWLSLGVLILGFCVLYFSPSMQSRIHDLGWLKEPNYDYISVLRFYVFPIWIMYVYLALFGIMVLRRGIRWGLSSIRDNIIYWVLALVPFVVYVSGSVAGTWPRVIWLTYVGFTLLLVQLVTSFKIPGRLAKASFVTATGLTALLVLFYVDLTTAQYRLTVEYKRIEKVLAADPGKNLYFADVSYPGANHWWVNHIVTGFIFKEAIFQNIPYQRITHRNVKDTFIFVSPKFNGKEMPAIPGSAGLKGKYPIYLSTKDYGRALPMDVKLEFPDSAKFFQKNAPMGVFRYWWNPRYSSDVEVEMWILRVKVPNTPRMKKAFNMEGDTLFFYRMEFDKSTLYGMVPARIDTIAGQ